MPDADSQSGVAAEHAAAVADEQRLLQPARRGIEDKTELGRHRWVVERTASWLLRFKRLGVRYDRTLRTLRPLLTLACVLIDLCRLVQQES